MELLSLLALFAEWKVFVEKHPVPTEWWDEDEKCPRFGRRLRMRNRC